MLFGSVSFGYLEVFLAYFLAKAAYLGWVKQLCSRFSERGGVMV